MMNQTQTMVLRGETLSLLPEKLIEWPTRRTLLVADTHFGKAATFRNFGIPVPEKTTHAMLDRLSRVIEQKSSLRLIVLGDFIHSSHKDSKNFEASLLKWRAKHDHLEVILLRGNHDRGRSDLFEKLAIRVVPDFLEEGPFIFAHDARSISGSSLYGLAGHIHPQIAMTEGKKMLRLPCFWFGSRSGLLPAYGDFTGCSTVKPCESDCVFVVAEGTVIKLSELTFATKDNRPIR